MSRALRVVVLLGIGFGLLGCADSHDKLMNDQMAYMADLTEIIEKVADGSISSAEGAERIGKWGKKGDEFVARKEKLNKDVSAEEMGKLAEKYSKESGELMTGYFEAVAKLQKSGRMTRELQEAMSRVN